MKKSEVLRQFFERNPHPPWIHDGRYFQNDGFGDAGSHCVHCGRSDCVCPPTQAICWSCGEPIIEGDGRTKSGWYVHPLCPIPSGAFTAHFGGRGEASVREGIGATAVAPPRPSANGGSDG